MMPSSPALPQRNAGIDILRGLSIVIVVCHHLNLRIPLAHTAIGQVLPHPLVAMFAWGGGDAVTMFFVLSGFLITRRTFTKYGDFREIAAAGFLLHRAARILPLLWSYSARSTAACCTHHPRYGGRKPICRASAPSPPACSQRG